MSNSVTAECSHKPNNKSKQNEINAWINKKYCGCHLGLFQYYEFEGFVYPS